MPVLPDSLVPLLEARGLVLDRGGPMARQGLDLVLRPGLTWVTGDEGSGKTRLLEVLAGEAPAVAGALVRHGAGHSFERPDLSSHDERLAREVLSQAVRRHADTWLEGLARSLTEALRLDEHLDKALFMLSRGTRRKLGLVLSAASGAAITLIDAPWAGLDARSVAVFSDVLEEAVDDPRRAWVLADHVVPAQWADTGAVGRVDLGPAG